MAIAKRLSRTIESQDLAEKLAADQVAIKLREAGLTSHFKYFKFLLLQQMLDDDRVANTAVEEFNRSLIQHPSYEEHSLLASQLFSSAY
jgi:hypothetical protein